jgi:hypothetical protein
MATIAEYMAENYGSQLISQDPSNPTRYIVEAEDADGNVKQMPVDVRALMAADAKENGIELDPNKIPVTSPQAPLKENGLSFMQQVSMARGRTAKDSIEFLKDRFGKDNIHFDRATGQASIKGEDGEWHRAEVDSGMAEMLSKAGPIAGAIAGGQIGLGAAGPIGAVVGAGVGAVVGSIADIGEAYAKGIRTEFDIKEVSAEIGNEMLIAMAGEGVGQIAMAAPGAMKRVFTGLKRNIPDVNKAAVAEMAAVSTGVDKEILEHTMHRPADVIGHQERAIRWEKATNPVQGSGAVNPLRQEQMELIEQTIQSSKDEMQRAYGASLQKIAAPAKEGGFGLQGMAFDGNQVMTELQAQLRPLGIIDDAGNFVKREAGLSRLAEEDVKQLRKFYKDVKATVERGKGVVPSRDVGFLHMNEMENLLGQAENFINLQPNLLGATAESQVNLLRMRDVLHDSVSRGLAQRNPEAAKFWQATRETYGARSQWLTEISKVSGPARIEGTLNRVLQLKKSSPSAQALSKLSEDLFGKKFRDELITQLMDRQAALETMMMRREGLTAGSFGGLVSNTIGMPVTSPRLVSRGLARISQQQFDQVKSLAKTSEFMAKLPPKALREAQTNPAALSAIMQTGMQYYQVKGQTHQQLMQEAERKIKGGQ